MPIYKIQAGRIVTVNSYDWVGGNGTLWYDGTLGDLRIGDGVTPGGRLLQLGGSGSGGVTITGSVANSSLLDPVYAGNVGDGVISEDTGDLWVWNGASWINVGTIKGPIGFTGSIGYTGSQGDIGYTGSQGDLGYTGSIGFTGSQGNIGYTGSQGSIGYTGSQGDLGYTGSQGDIGYTGSQGDLGYTGSQGDLGYTGSQGDIGYTGSQGDLGYTGSQGDLGYIGSQGDIGYTGSQGDLGYTGSQGADGFTGSQGADGFTGSQGDLGYTGSQGDAGFTGSQGADGFTGSQGDAGFTGSIGYTGSQGDLGYTGSAGANGTSVQIVGSTSTYATLDVSYAGAIGDGYITSDNGHLNVWLGNSWSDVGNIVGPKGDLGYTGSAGQDGIIGYNGSDGYTGSQGYTGSAGPGADQDLNTTSSVTFANLTLATAGVITFADGTIQRTKSPQMYTNADAEAGLTIDDMFPGDFYYDDASESIFIMVDTGYGYNNLLDLTVRAA